MASYYSCDVSKDAAEPPDMATTYPYPLDPFQKHAIAAIHQDHNVLVCAKTGSGKTLVGEYEIAYCLKNGKRVFYTTPIKSLSNQKFHDLKEMYKGRVGIMTGDIKFCPDADIVIMTTEILRNLLYKKGTKTEALGLTASLSLKDLGAVIFDECHYINDRDRGKIWEETMILLPQPVQLILLSATLDSPQYFAQWLSELKGKPCALIETQYRVVPLIHSVLIGRESQILMDAKEIFNPKTYNDWLQWRKSRAKEKDDYKRLVHNARIGGHEGRVEGKVTIASFNHQLNDFVEMLQDKELMPALTFVFSRQACEKFADKVTHQLLDSSDSALAERIFDFHLRKHKANLETLPQYHHLRKQVARGIAFHHSGILPVLKEVIEILLAKGLIKLLFATETFAVGLNMPTKTVLFVGFHKYDSEKGGMRILRTDEYIQMAGRAGRRGKDTIGHVFYIPEKEPVEPAEIEKMMKGGKPRVESRMDFGYDFLLKTLNTGDLTWLGLLEKSYWFRQLEQVQKTIKTDIKKLSAEIDTIILTDDEIKAIDEKKVLEQTISSTQNAKKRDAQRALERWKDVHIGQRWFAAEANYKKKYILIGELNTSENNLRDLEKAHLISIDIKLDYLVLIDFLDQDKKTLTPRGVAATEFNEGQPILCTELAFRHTIGDLDTDDFVTCLACFVTDSDKDEQPSLASLDLSAKVKNALEKIGALAFELGQKEYNLTKKDTRFWDLSTTWLEPVSAWLSGCEVSKICVDYGIFEGNFVRTIMRLANLVDEWTSVATFIEDIELLEKLRDVRGRLVKDVIIPDSLYLHI